MDGNYVTLAVTLAVWVGLFWFVFKLDRKVTNLEKRSR